MIFFPSAFPELQPSPPQQPKPLSTALVNGSVPPTASSSSEISEVAAAAPTTQSIHRDEERPLMENNPTNTSQANDESKNSEVSVEVQPPPIADT